MLCVDWISFFIFSAIRYNSGVEEARGACLALADLYKDPSFTRSFAEAL